MTQKEKDLLLQDLCARLPYGVKFVSFSQSMKNHSEPVTLRQIYYHNECDANNIEGDNDISTIIEFVKPYLRPLSSMTNEEIKDLEKYTHYSFTYNPGDVEIRNIQYQAYDGISFDTFVKATFNMPVSSCSCVRLIKWLNSHHFDYCGLIERGLALEAPEGMYN
jgi:hypothetical protein